MRLKRFLTVLLAAFVALVVVQAAVAAWSMSSSGNGNAKALSMPAGSAPTKAVTNPNIALSWSAVTVGGSAVDSYTVRRYTEAGVLQTITAGCSGAIAATTCTESSVPVGRWQYTTQPDKAGWTGAESAKSATAEIVAAPTAVGATKYINNAGKASVNVQVTVAASSLSTDTVHLTLTDSASTTVTATTQAAPAGAGTVTFTGLDTTSLVDGNVTATAWVTSNTSDASPSTTTTLVRDIVVPTAVDIYGTNGGGTAKKIDTAGGDTLVYIFSEPMDPASIQAGWSGASTTVNPSIVGGDTITVAAALGSVSTGTAGYVQSGFTVTCSTTTMVMSGSTVTLNLNNCLPTARLKFGTATETFVWMPSASATDQAGNPMSTTLRNEVGGPKANF